MVSSDATGGDGGSGEPPECAYGKVAVRPLRPRDPVPVPGLLKEISMTHLGGMQVLINGTCTFCPLHSYYNTATKTCDELASGLLHAKREVRIFDH